MKICNIKVCDRPFSAKGLCHSHYVRNRYYKKALELPVSPSSVWGIKFINQKDYNKKYHKLRGIGTIKEMHEKRFGGMREQVILRDKEKCVMCGMTRATHKAIFDRDLTINHIDHQSARSASFDGYINNDGDNLETLCLRCHGAIDGMKHGKYSKYLVNLKKKGGNTHGQISE